MLSLLVILVIAVPACAYWLLAGMKGSFMDKIIGLEAENAVLKSELERLRNTEIPVKITR